MIGVRLCFILAALPGLLATAAAQETFGALRVTVLDPRGEPVRGAVVEVLRYDGADALYSNLDIGEKADHRTAAKMPTPKNGSIGIQIAAALPHRVRVDVAPYAIEYRRDVFAGQELVIQLRHGATVTGVVRDKVGNALAAEKVTLRLDPAAGRQITNCEADGSFRFERVMPGKKLWLDVEASQAASGSGQDVSAAAGERAEIEFVLDPGARIRGRVTDEATGAPIAGAVFAVCWTFDKPVRTDADGRYSFQGLGGPFSNNMYLRAPGYRKLQIDRPQSKDGADVTLDLELSRGVAVTGRVLDGDGTPVAGCYVAAIGMSQGNRQETDWYSTRTDQAGRFTIGDLRAELGPVLLIRHDQRATTLLPIPDFGDAPTLRLGDVTLRPRRILQGTLLGSDGAPLAGEKVKLAGTNADAPSQALATGAKMGSLLASYVGKRHTVTDADGRFWFGDLDDGTWQLDVAGEQQQIVIRGRSPEPLALRR